MQAYVMEVTGSSVMPGWVAVTMLGGPGLLAGGVPLLASHFILGASWPIAVLVGIAGVGVYVWWLKRR